MGFKISQNSAEDPGLIRSSMAVIGADHDGLQIGRSGHQPFVADGGEQRSECVRHPAKGKDNRRGQCVVACELGYGALNDVSADQQKKRQDVAGILPLRLDLTVDLAATLSRFDTNRSRKIARSKGWHCKRILVSFPYIPFYNVLLMLSYLRCPWTVQGSACRRRLACDIVRAGRRRKMFSDGEVIILHRQAPCCGIRTPGNPPSPQKAVGA